MEGGNISIQDAIIRHLNKGTNSCRVDADCVTPAELWRSLESGSPVWRALLHSRWDMRMGAMETAKLLGP